MSVVNQVESLRQGHALLVEERMKAKANAFDWKEGYHDTWKLETRPEIPPGIDFGPRWIVINDVGALAECKSREEARREWKRLKG